MERMSASKSRAMDMMKAVLLSYGITILLLLIVSFLMLQFGISGGVAGIAIIAIYIIASFGGGFYMGKHVEQKRYIWGLLIALIYFMVYILISLFVKGDSPVIFMDYIKTLLILCLGGMIGGMLS